MWLSFPCGTLDKGNDMSIGKYSRNHAAVSAVPVKSRICVITGERLPVAQLQRAELTVSGLSIDFGYIRADHSARFADFCVRVRGLWSRKIASMTPKEMLAFFGLRQSEEIAKGALALAK